MKNKPVITIIGAGSLFFGRQAIWAVNHLDGLKGCILRLVDTDPDHLKKMVKLAEMAAESSDSGTAVEGYADYRDALGGSDFVLLSFSKNNAHYRRIDCEVSARFGIRMCSGDTIGPGGLFRTMREFPIILEIAHAVEQQCPDAWLINYVNPSAIMGIGLSKYSKAKNFALCDTHHMPGKKHSYLKMIGEEPTLEGLDLRIAGVNHFTWMLKAELNGTDIMPRIHEAFREHSLGEKDAGYAKERFNNFITAQLGDVFGALPTCTGHTKEYLPYYQGTSAIREPIPPLSVFDCDEREIVTQKMWSQIDDWVEGRESMDSFHKDQKSDHATDIMQTMILNNGRTYYINRTNQECVEGGGRPVTNLPEDAFLELECKLDANGPKPLPVGDLPVGIRGLQQQILDAHETTIDAIVRRDRTLLVRALAMDPLVNSIATAGAVIDALFEAQAEFFTDWPEKAKNSFVQLRESTRETKVGEQPKLY